MITGLVLGAGGIVYPREADFPEDFSGRPGALKKRWPVDANEIQTTYLIAENLVNGWDIIKDEFQKTKTLKDKNLLIAMMYQP